MIYLSSFKLSNQTLKNPNIYPYNIFMEITGVENPHFLTSLLVN